MTERDGGKITVFGKEQYCLRAGDKEGYRRCFDSSSFVDGVDDG